MARNPLGNRYLQNPSRSDFIKAAAIAVGTASALAGSGSIPVQVAGKPKKLSPLPSQAASDITHRQF